MFVILIGVDSTIGILYFLRMELQISIDCVNYHTNVVNTLNMEISFAGE